MTCGRDGKIEYSMDRDCATCNAKGYVTCRKCSGKDVLKKLTRNYALEITFSASGNGHVWICLPQSKAGWTGISQQNPIIRGNKVIILCDDMGSHSAWKILRAVDCNSAA